MKTRAVDSDRLTLLRVSGSNSHDIVPYSGQDLR